MSYVEGFVAAVPAANRDAYIQRASEAWEMFRELGVARMVETWGDNVPEGVVTDFRRAVKAEPGEEVVFSWFEYPDRAARDAANARLMDDARMKDLTAAMPFDAKRMVYGGFASVIEVGAPGKPGYVDGSLIAVRTVDKDSYVTTAGQQVAVLMDHGASRVVAAWGDDTPTGETTDFGRAVQASDDETVVFTWIEWPSKQARDAAWPEFFADPRMHAGHSPVDESRRVRGGFAPVLDL